jgi:tRNA G26 N,N-dimethylase Trm1
MATQVKEKFGGLRFYMGGGTDSMIEEFIDQAEAQAEKTCEDCGKPGKIAGPGWIRTLCYGCRVERSGKECADKIEAAYANPDQDNDVGVEVG